jgi:hypothetical protein
MMWLPLIVPLTLLFSNLFSQQATTYSQQATATSPTQLPPEVGARIERSRQIAIEINDLAGRIRSEADAKALVDKIADVFAASLPPSWMTSDFRQRIAHAEYEAVSDSSQLIPEQSIADIWNEYVREIGAPDEALVTAAELHNLRDAHFASAQFSWPHGQGIWTVPNIYSVDSSGKLAEGCRAIETLRILYDVDMLFDNLRGARERVRKGVLVSDELKRLLEKAPPQKTSYHLETHISNNPVWPAERRYIQEHGPFVLNGVVEKLFDELFPSFD